jgi:hypothetical protein
VQYHTHTHLYSPNTHLYSPTSGCVRKVYSRKWLASWRSMFTTWSSGHTNGSANCEPGNRPKCGNHTRSRCSGWYKLNLEKKIETRFSLGLKSQALSSYVCKLNSTCTAPPRPHSTGGRMSRRPSAAAIAPACFICCSWNLTSLSCASTMASCTVSMGGNVSSRAAG